MILPLPELQNPQDNKQLAKAYDHMQALIDSLNQQEVPLEIKEKINEELKKVETKTADWKAFRKQLRISHRKIINLSVHELNLVPQRYYMTLWMSMGMAIFGVPLGMMISLALNNFGMLGAGIGMGMGIGIVVGIQLDKKAEAEGRQLSASM